MIAPGVAIVMVVLAFNFLSDSLQVALHPQLRQSSHSQQKLKWFKAPAQHEKEVVK